MAIRSKCQLLNMFYGGLCDVAPACLSSLVSCHSSLGSVTLGLQVLRFSKPFLPHSLQKCLECSFSYHSLSPHFSGLSLIITSLQTTFLK